MSEEKKAIKKIRSTGLMREIMGAYFMEFKEAVEKGSPKIAWCTSVGPAELLRALGFLVYFPENHGALLGSSRMATDLIPEANAVGYSPEICSYLTSDVGSYLAQKTPLTKAFGMKTVPKADVLVYNTNQCRDVKDWFEFYHREFNVPILGVSTPRGLGDLTETHLGTVVAQMKDMVPALEEVAGRSFDMDELKRVVDLSRQCTEGWKRVLRSAISVPSPISFFDGTIHMGPAVVLRGEERAVDYYETLGAELEERIEQGIGAVDGERFRIYWEGMPIWGETPGTRRALHGPEHLRRSLHLLQQLDFRSPRPGGSVWKHGPGLHRAVHRPLRGLQGGLSRANGERLRAGRHPVPRCENVPLQFEQPLRDAGETQEETVDFHSDH